MVLNVSAKGEGRSAEAITERTVSNRKGSALYKSSDKVL
jgi:hypothetical protein